MFRRGIVALAILACTSCTGAPSSPSPTASGPSKIGVATPLGGNVVARVGDTNIERALVAEVMTARKLSSLDAARALIDEALLAEAAKKSGGVEERSVRLRTASALARTVVARFTAEARALGPITEEELGEVMGDEWIQLDRPETRVAAHALIRAGAADGPSLAEKLREKLETSPTTEAFLADAKAFPLPDGVGRVVESLPQPFTVDGRLAVSNAPTSLLPEFCKGAFAVEKVGGTSAVIVTKFGWHVIRVVEIRPPFRATYAERAKKLEGDVLRKRGYERYEKFVADLRAKANVQVIGADADLGLPRSDFGGDVHVEAPR